MPSPTQIAVSQLHRLIGTPAVPMLIDVRQASHFAADPRVIPAAYHLDLDDVRKRAQEFAGKSVVTYCADGGALSQGVAAWLRHAGAHAESLDGGFAAWRNSGAPLLNREKLPARDVLGRTVWVTRARPKIVRIACPWLIRRFVDPSAVFLYVTPAEVADVAQRFGAAAFDAEGAAWGDRGERCTFDVMVEELGLATVPLMRLAAIVRGADTGQLELAPQCAGLLAASLGYSRMYRDDLAQLDAALGLYDALFRWCRDAVDETHGELPTA